MKTLAVLLVAWQIAWSGAPLEAADTPNDVQAKLDQLVKELLADKEDLARKKVQRAAATAEADKRDLDQAVTDARGALAQAIASRMDLILGRGMLSSIEQKQISKQIGAPGAAGGTSVASKGPAPKLIGLAVENGALQQTVAGTTVTIRGNPTGILAALAKKDLIKSSDAIASEAALRFLQRFSFAATYDISKGSRPNTLTANDDQLAGWSGRVELLNYRDPRARRYAADWARFMESARSLGSGGNELFFALQTNQRFLAWEVAAAQAIENAATADVRGVVEQQLDAARGIINEVPALKARFKTAGGALDDYTGKRTELINRIAGASVLTLEYNNIHQFLGAGDASPKPPDLSNLKLVYTRKFVGDSEFTWNTAATLFNYRPKVNGKRITALRDLQSAAQFDVPLPEIQNLGKGVLTFAGLVLKLNHEPLGQSIQVNGKDVKATGLIGVGQVKLSFPITDGVQIPIAFTYASRTELLPDKSDIRGNIGITFDVDKLFAKDK